MRDTSDQTALFTSSSVFPSCRRVDVVERIRWQVDHAWEALCRERRPSWHNFLDAPRARGDSVASVRWGARPASVCRPHCGPWTGCAARSLRTGLPEHLTQSRVDEASAALSELCALFGVEQREAEACACRGGSGWSWIRRARTASARGTVGSSCA